MVKQTHTLSLTRTHRQTKCLLDVKFHFSGLSLPLAMNDFDTEVGKLWNANSNLLHHLD